MGSAFTSVGGVRRGYGGHEAILQSFHATFLQHGMVGTHKKSDSLHPGLQKGFLPISWLSILSCAHSFQTNQAENSSSMLGQQLFIYHEAQKGLQYWARLSARAMMVTREGHVVIVLQYA